MSRSRMVRPDRSRSEYRFRRNAVETMPYIGMYPHDSGRTGQAPTSTHGLRTGARAFTNSLVSRETTVRP
jgi:hypothetical protein